METPTRNKLPKQTKLCSLTAIDALFASGKGALAYPLRMLCAPSSTPGIKFFISVPKKRLRHAVDRVLMRRRIREAYRLMRPELSSELSFNIAFIYVGKGLESYSRVEHALRKLLAQLDSYGTGS